MEKANLVIFQKDDHNLDVLNEWFKYRPHNIVTMKHTLNECLSSIYHISRLEESLKPHAIILDGNLTEGEHLCNDAKKIIERLQVYKIGATVIGYSEVYLSGQDIQINCDFDIGKDPRKLIRIIEDEL